MNKINLDILYTCSKSIRDWDCIFLINEKLQSNNIRRKINTELKISNYNNKKREQFDIISPIIISILYLNRKKYNNINLKCKIKNIEHAVKEIFKTNWDYQFILYDIYSSYEEEYFFNNINKLKVYNYACELIDNKILLPKYFLFLLCEIFNFMVDHHRLFVKEYDIINQLKLFYIKKINNYRIYINDYHRFGDRN